MAEDFKFKTVDIKGKAYVEVSERIKYFRTSEEYKGWALVTSIVELNDEKVVLRAEILDDNNVLKATGLSYEMANSSYINKTSYIENCETSAWGRALANLGIGVDTSIASSLEVINAINNQGGESKAVVKNAMQEKIEKQAAELKEKKETLTNLFTQVKGDKTPEELYEAISSSKKEFTDAIKGVDAAKIDSLINKLNTYVNGDIQ